MKARELRKRTGGRCHAALAVLGVLGLAFAAAVSLCAQEAPATNSSSGQVVTAYLDFQDASYSYMDWESPVGTRSAAFKQEPAFGPDKVTRGALQPGGRGSDAMAFAWDRTARKLYLDLNRNQDLTDDPGGVFSSASVRGDNFQTFTNIHVPVQTAAGSRQMLVDLNFYDYGSGTCCGVALRSFWQGKVTLHGEEWQVGLMANRPGQKPSFEHGSLLLRPWAERSQPFNVQSGTLAALPFSRKVFFGNRAYQLHCTNEVQGDSLKVRLQFTEQSPKLGELKVTGRFVERVALEGLVEGEPCLVVIDHPEGLVKVPAGNYGPAKVWLKQGEAEAYSCDRTGSSAERVTVNENRPTVLAAGGALTNSVLVSRRGRNLWLDYRLIGAGREYQIANQDRSQPPEFTVYRGDKKAASGKFRFG